MLKTTDLYLSAYLLTQHIPPQEILTEGQRKRKIIFKFPDNPKSQLHISRFNEGNAVVNIKEFRYQYEFVRDLMFSKLREN